MDAMWRQSSEYMLKGTDPNVCPELGIAWPNERDQGKIVGKRCGYSQVLSPEKRKDWPIITFPRHPRVSVAGPERRLWNLVKSCDFAFLDPTDFEESLTAS
jgi:hypothetical protein